MRLSAEAAQALVVQTLARSGLSSHDAEIVAQALVEAELCGRATHGLARLPGIARTCRELCGGPPVLVTDRGAAACLDGRGGLGYVVCHRAVREATERAQRHGLAVVAVRNVRHMGMLGYYVRLLAERDIVGLAFADCRPLVAPFGGTQAVLGTNPIAAAFPWQPFPIVIDTGTSAVTFGDVMLARTQGRPLPAGVALDSDGRPTIDAAKATAGALLPWAGHRGYVFGVMAQLFAGALTLAGGLPTSGDDYGMLILALRANLFGEREAYMAEVSRFVAATRAARKASGVREILLPGERAWRERSRRLREGIEVPDELLREIRGG